VDGWKGPLWPPVAGVSKEYEEALTAYEQVIRLYPDNDALRPADGIYNVKVVANQNLG